MHLPLRNRAIALACAALVAFSGVPMRAAFAQEAAPEAPPAPTPDSVIDQLLALDPAQLAEKVRQMKADAAKLAGDAAELRKQAEALDGEITALNSRLESFMGIMKALAAAEGMVPKPADAPEQAAMAPGGEMAAAVMGPALNFEDHVAPLFEARCMRCHNGDDKEGGLSLETFEEMMAGGSSGQALLAAGNPDGSRLLRLVMQIETPNMPPRGSPLVAEEVDLIRQWILGGVRKDAASEGMAVAAAPTINAEVFVAAKMSDGPPPMPEVQLAALAPKNPRGVVARAIAASKTAPLLAVGGDGQILLYDLTNFALLGALPFEGDPYTMTFSVNGEILVAGGGEEGKEGHVTLYDVRKAAVIGKYGNGYDTVLAADISPDHKMIAVGGPAPVVRVFSTTDGALLYKMDAHTDWIYSVKFSPDGELLATADRQGGLYLWQAANGRAVENLRGHNGAINDMAYSADSNVLATASDDGSVILWDTWKYNQIRKFGAHSGGVHAIDFSAAGQLVTAGRDGMTKRWDINGAEQKAYENMADWAYQSCFGAQDGVVVTGAWSGRIAVWNTESGEKQAEFTTNPDSELMVAAQKGGQPDQAP